MSNLIKLAHMKARSSVLKGMICDLIGDDRCYAKEINELILLDDQIAEMSK